MNTIKGPAIFLAQFFDSKAPFNNLQSICKWAKDLRFEGAQLPTWDTQYFNLHQAAESQIYADEIKEKFNDLGLQITELSTHLQGQLVAVKPAYDQFFDSFTPLSVKGNPKARIEWAIQQLKYAAKASQNLGSKACRTFSRALLWQMVYPWPQRPVGLIEAGFKELANRWLPILNSFDEYGIDLCFEVHPREDIYDDITYEMFLAEMNNHPRVCILCDPSYLKLQCLAYQSYINHYQEFIKMFHVKDAEFNPTAKQGVYGGYQNWVNRAGLFRSLGDGQIDFKSIFSKLAAYKYKGWAVMEWDCALKHPERELNKV
jgi:sugar phosphate isomerase/epimerase